MFGSFWASWGEAKQVVGCKVIHMNVLRRGLPNLTSRTSSTRVNNKHAEARSEEEYFSTA